MPRKYDAAKRSNVTLDEAQAAVGQRASLTLTGVIVDAGTSAAGVFVRFALDRRWGFREGECFVMDLDPFALEAECDHDFEPWPTCLHCGLQIDGGPR